MKRSTSLVLEKSEHKAWQGDAEKAGRTFTDHVTACLREYHDLMQADGELYCPAMSKQQWAECCTRTSILLEVLAKNHPVNDPDEIRHQHVTALTIAMRAPYDTTCMNACVDSAKLFEMIREAKS